MVDVYETTESKIIERIFAHLKQSSKFSFFTAIKEWHDYPKGDPRSGQSSFKDFPIFFMKLRQKKYRDTGYAKQTIDATFDAGIMYESFTREEAARWMYKAIAEFKAYLASNPHLDTLDPFGDCLTNTDPIVRRVWLVGAEPLFNFPLGFDLLALDVSATWEELLESRYGLYTWDVIYTADALPQNSTPAWTRAAAGGATDAVSGGILTVTLPNSGDMRYWRVVSAVKMTLDSLVQVPDALTYYTIVLSDGSYNNKYAQVAMDRTHIFDNNGPGTALVDFTKYHAVRLTFDSGAGEYKVYVDGAFKFNVVAVGAIGFDAVFLQCYGSNPAASGHVKIDEVRYRLGDCYVP